MRRVLLTLLKITITTAVLVYIVHHLGWQHIYQTARAANTGWLLGAALVFALSGVLGAWQWQLLLVQRGVKLSFRRITALYFMGLFFNNFILGTAAADAVRVTYVKLGQESAKAGFGATFLDRFVGLLALLVLAMGGSLLLLSSGMVNNRALGTSVVALSATFVSFAAITLVLLSRRLQGVLRRVIARFSFPYKTGVLAVLDQVVVDRSDTAHLWGVWGLAVLVQVLRIGVHLLCALSLGMLTINNYHYFFIFVPILAIFMILPMPFGVREGLEGTLLTMAGFAPGAVVIGFLASITSIIASLPGGFFFLTLRSRSKRGLRTP